MGEGLSWEDPLRSCWVSGRASLLEVFFWYTVNGGYTINNVWEEEKLYISRPVVMFTLKCQENLPAWMDKVGKFIYSPGY